MKTLLIAAVAALSLCLSPHEPPPLAPAHAHSPFGKAVWLAWGVGVIVMFGYMAGATIRVRRGRPL